MHVADRPHLFIEQFQLHLPIITAVLIMPAYSTGEQGARWSPSDSQGDQEAERHPAITAAGLRTSHASEHESGSAGERLLQVQRWPRQGVPDRPFTAAATYQSLAYADISCDEIAQVERTHGSQGILSRA